MSRMAELHAEAGRLGIDTDADDAVDQVLLALAAEEMQLEVAV